MTQGSNSRIGIAAGRAAVGANVEAVMSNPFGDIASPCLDMLRRGKGLTLGRKTDHSGATVPDLHRLPSATRMFTIRPLAALSNRFRAISRPWGHQEIAATGGCDLTAKWHARIFDSMVPLGDQKGMRCGRLRLTPRLPPQL